MPPPVPTAGETVNVGGTTYTFATAINAQSAANTVLIGTDIATTLANLAGAINASTSNGQAAGTTYSTSTVANTAVTATGTTATSLSLQAITGGVAGNADTTSSQWTAGTFGGGDLTGGVDAVPSSATFTVGAGTLPTAGETVAVGGTTYTFVGAVGNLTSANDVLIGGTTSATLANLAGAINASTTSGQGAGATYGTGTTANTAVTATGSTATTIGLQAVTGGANGNSFATATTWNGGLFAVSDLAGGASGVAATAILNVPAASLPNAGTDTIAVGGTTYTFVGAVGNLTSANTVLIGANTTETLANLAGAINASTTGGQGAGTTYGAGTSANSSVTATGSTVAAVSLQALQTGTTGNSLAVSTSWSGALFGAGSLAGGVNAVDAAGTLNVAIPLPTAGQTVTVGGTTYTFQSALTGEPADTVMVGNSVQSTLNNLAAAINGDPTQSGKTFTAATQANTSARAAVSTASTLTLTAIQTGTAGNNSIASATDWAGGSFGAAQLAGGVNAAAATGSYAVPISVPTAGNTVTVGGSTYTFVGSVANLTGANDVLIGADVQSTLANLAGAINASTANGQGAGVTYGVGTVPNTSVTSTGSTATTLAVQALQSGSVSNTIPTSTTWAPARSVRAI